MNADKELSTFLFYLVCIGTPFVILAVVLLLRKFKKGRPKAARRRRNIFSTKMYGPFPSAKYITLRGDRKTNRFYRVR